MATGKRVDPLTSASFYLDIGGKVTGFFRECSGLGSESEVVEHKATAKGGFPVIIKVPGAVKWQNVVLKRGVTNDMEIWNWRKEVEDGKVEKARRDGSIIMFDQTRKEMARWNFTQAWPVKVSGPSLNAGTNEIAIEELTISHEGMKRTK
jgi:phage tail-like protein